MHIQGFFITVSLADKHLTKSLVFIIKLENKLAKPTTCDHSKIYFFEVRSN